MSNKIAIKPYFEKTSNMGLEKHNQVVFEGVSHKIPIWAKEDVTGSGRVRLITGLNEFAPEISSIKDDEERVAKIKEIRVKVAYIEKITNSNEVKITDPKFWEKIKVVTPENHGFWANITVTPSNEPIYLDPENIEDLIKISAIEAGGMPGIAPSLEAAKTAAKKPKFYLDRLEETAISTTKVSIIETRAKVMLLNLFDGNIEKLRLVCKVVDVNSTQYKKTTPNEVLYGNMIEFIEGRSGTLKKDAPTIFLRKAELDMETLKLTALVKESNFYRILVVRSGQIYEGNYDTPLGYNIPEAVEFLKNPLNEGVLQRLLIQIEKYWNA